MNTYKLINIKVDKFRLDIGDYREVTTPKNERKGIYHFRLRWL